MNDLTQYNSSELSMHVYNDEMLYNLRDNRAHLMSVIEAVFIYTPEQMQELITDLDEEQDEDEHEHDERTRDCEAADAGFY